MTDKKTEESESKDLTVGGAIDALIKAAIPSVAKDTVAKLVLGVGAAGSSWLDALASQGQRVRESIDLKKSLAKVDAARALASLSEGDEVAQVHARATLREASEALRKQENIEAVASEAIEMLGEGAPKENVPPVDQDWLNTFSAFAEKASSEGLRKHWAAVLAGEIRAPGAVSLAALQMLSIMDQKTAKRVALVRSWTMGETIPMTQSLRRGDRYAMLVSLQAIGFLSLGHSTTFYNGIIYQFNVGASGVVFQAPDREVSLSVAMVTAAGMEILQLLPPTSDEPFVEEVMEELRRIEMLHVGRALQPTQRKPS